jgi:hypothetical protein
MSAHAHTRSHSQAAGSVDTRLPWWALALPMLAFAVLLLVIAGPGQAQAAAGDPAGDPAVGQLFERVQQTLSR